MSLCPALAAAAAETPPRDLRGEGPAHGARGSKLCCAVPAAALARGPERAGPQRAAPTVSSSFLATAASRGPRGLTLFCSLAPSHPGGAKGDACLTARDLGAVNHARCSAPAPRGRSRTRAAGTGNQGSRHAVRVRSSPDPPLRAAPAPSATWPRPPVLRPRGARRRPGASRAGPRDHLGAPSHQGWPHTLGSVGGRRPLPSPGSPRTSCTRGDAAAAGGGFARAGAWGPAVRPAAAAGIRGHAR